MSFNALSFSTNQDSKRDQLQRVSYNGQSSQRISFNGTSVTGVADHPQARRTPRHADQRQALVGSKWNGTADGWQGPSSCGHRQAGRRGPARRTPICGSRHLVPDVARLEGGPLCGTIPLTSKAIQAVSEPPGPIGLATAGRPPRHYSGEHDGASRLACPAARNGRQVHSSSDTRDVQGRQPTSSKLVYSPGSRGDYCGPRCQAFTSTAA